MEEAPPSFPGCHSVFGSNPLHFSSIMGKQSVISPITPSLQRRSGGNGLWRELAGWRAVELQQ